MELPLSIFDLPFSLLTATGIWVFRAEPRRDSQALGGAASLIRSLVWKSVLVGLLWFTLSVVFPELRAAQLILAALAASTALAWRTYVPLGVFYPQPQVNGLGQHKGKRCLISTR